MVSIDVLARIFLVGFILNIVWEFSHCMLYETCRRQTWQENIPLLVIMSVKDGFFITLFYLVSAVVFSSAAILENTYQLLFFAVMALGFAFIDERVSIRRGRWEYAAAMPRIFGVGITPLLEIAVTGILSCIIVLTL